MKNSESEIPVALTIAGSDSGGGAGIQADLLTFAVHGVFGATAITALTAQNPAGVSGVRAVPADFVREQAEQVARFFRLRAAKTGMLANAEIISAVADFFESHKEIPLVLDPVMIATSGAKLLDDAALAALRERLIPLAALVTPNLDEAEALAGEKFAWRGNAEIRGDGERRETVSAAEKLAAALGVPVLLKGGHGCSGEIFDAFAAPQSAGTLRGNGERPRSVVFSHPRIEKTNTHGSGCTLSAAVAANLAFPPRGGEDFPARLEDAVARALRWLAARIAAPVSVAGEKFISRVPAAPPDNFLRGEEKC